MSTREDERFLANLLTDMRLGTVVAVVGWELLLLPPDPAQNGRRLRLDQEIARRVAEDLDVSGLPEPSELRDVGPALAQQHPDDRDDLYPSVYRAVEALGSADFPELELLAEITDLQVFVSTTFDDALGKTLDEVRFGGKARTVRRAYASPRWEASPAATRQEPLGAVIGRGEPVVYRIFGEVANVPRYAVTENDTLEIVHHLQVTPPQDLFGLLRGKQLLFLGCGLQDWVARFFIRAMKGEPLATGSRAAVADETMSGEKRLVTFLQQNRTRVFHGGGAAELVRRLHQAWKAEQARRAPPPSTVGGVAGAAAGGAGSGVPVFVSYADDDERYWKELEGQLTSIRRQGLVSISSRADLGVGADWREATKTRIEAADMILLLLGPASDPRQDLEIQLALAEGQRARVIPIRVRDRDWDALPTDIQSRQPLPADGTPVASRANRDEAWAEIAKTIRVGATAIRAAEVGVFLSCAPDDRDAVREVKRELDRLNVPAWLDEQAPDPARRRRVEERIERCALFVPFLSRRALAQAAGSFHEGEWRLALEQTRQVAPGLAFIVPAALDDTAPDPPPPGLLPELAKLEWIRETEQSRLARRILELWRAKKREEQ